MLAAAVLFKKRLVHDIRAIFFGNLFLLTFFDVCFIYIVRGVFVESMCFDAIVVLVME